MCPLNVVYWNNVVGFPETFNMKTSTTLREQFMATIVCITSISKKCCIVFLPNSIMNSRSVYVGCHITIILWIQRLGGEVLFTELYLFYIEEDKICIGIFWYFDIYIYYNISHAIVVPLIAQQFSKKWSTLKRLPAFTFLRIRSHVVWNDF